MKEINSFIAVNNLRPADAIVLRKKGLGLLNHYAIYLGYSEIYGHRFAANSTQGVRVLDSEEAFNHLLTLEPTNIERFEGSDSQRKSAVRRALSHVGRTSYNLIFNNCEHYKNIVQFGNKYSKQVENVGDALLAISTFTGVYGIASKNRRAQQWALGLLAIGLIAKGGAGKKQ